jgi:antitoxin component of RelBE/YafQ-DinJ toxin-antitoxin module
MTTVSITLENNTMVSALRNLLSQLIGVRNVMFWENDTLIPNKKTTAALKELQQGGGKVFASVDALFDDLEN